MLRILVICMSCFVITSCSSSGEDQNTSNVVFVKPDGTIASEQNTSAVMDDESGNMPDSDNFSLPADSGETPAPSGISIIVLSDTMAELEWFKSLESDGILVYEIWRDGMLIEAIPGGESSSYVDIDRTPLTVYTYHIVAISSSGRATTKFVESNGTHPNPVWRGGNPTELPTPLNIQLANTFELANGIAVHKLLAFAIKVNDNTPDELGLSFIEANEPALMSYDCPDGGTISLGQRKGFFQEFTASNCSIFPITFNGNLFFEDRTFDPVNPSVRGFTGWSFSNGTSLLDARDSSSITIGGSSVELWPDSRTIKDFEISNLKVNGPDHTYAARSFSSSYVYTNAVLSFLVNGYGISGGLGTLSRLRTMDYFSEGAAGRPIVGALAFSSMNVGNETYGINANNVYPDAFTLDTAVNGTSISYDVSWSDSLNFSFPDASEIDLGF